MKLLEYSKE
jgi:putative resolvase